MSKVCDVTEAPKWPYFHRMRKWRGDDGYDGCMDSPVISLCNAINLIPGLKTNGSCCGHGRSPIRIWLSARNIHSLFVLARCLDIRYCAPENWSCIVNCTDTPERAVTFCLSSGESKGRKAYAEAKKLAQSIQDLLKNKTVVRMFRIK